MIDFDSLIEIPKFIVKSKKSFFNNFGHKKLSLYLRRLKVCLKIKIDSNYRMNL